jgi:hypothetical protein
VKGHSFDRTIVLGPINEHSNVTSIHLHPRVVDRSVFPILRFNVNPHLDVVRTAATFLQDFWLRIRLFVSRTRYALDGQLVTTRLSISCDLDECEIANALIDQISNDMSACRKPTITHDNGVYRDQFILCLTLQFLLIGES